jgi:hypothetical protein
MLRAVRRPPFTHVRSSGDAVVGSLVMDAGDVTPGMAEERDEFVREVRLPCSALSLDSAGLDTGGPELQGDGTFWRLRRLGTPIVRNRRR